MSRPCQRCACPVDESDLRCPLCALATQHPEPQPNGARVARCPECGASVTWSAEQQSARCAFCSGATRVEDAVRSVTPPDRILPFQVTPEDARAAVKRWLGSGIWRPFGFANSARLQTITPVWWAGYRVHARAFLSWTADSDHGGRPTTSGLAPHTGQSRLDVGPLLLSATRGLSLEETDRLTPHYDGNTAAPLHQRASFGPGTAEVEPFDADRAALRASCVDAIAVVAPNMLRAGIVPGRRIERVRVSPIIEAMQSEHIGLPVYILAYRYDDQLYRVLVHGQRRDIVFGAAPTSRAKMVLMGIVIALALAAMLVSRFL